MQSAYRGLRSLRLLLEDFENYTGGDDAHQHENDAVGTRGLLVLLRLHNLLQTLLHLDHRLIHVIIDSVHDRSLLDDQLVQILEDLSELLRALRYGERGSKKTNRSAESPGRATASPSASYPQRPSASG